jgi:hypothetical protein
MRGFAFGKLPTRVHVTASHTIHDVLADILLATLSTTGDRSISRLVRM